jgi:hypothetical protein
MKARICLLLLVCLSLPARAENTPKLEVHEWGTMTVLSGSDGIPLTWYQGQGFTDELPSFVQINYAGGKGIFNPQGSLVRMETPVIYFYPDKPLRVNVTATFIGGNLTEWFPAAKPNVRVVGQPFFGLTPNGTNLEQPQVPPPLPVTWEGDLLSPQDKKAQAQIPAVLAGKGHHYRHAREVPDAWIFRSTTPAMRPENEPAKGHDAEKFIFYRGMGASAPPYVVKAGHDRSVTFTHRGGKEGISAAFALTVENGSVRWARMPQLESLNGNTDLLQQVQSFVKLDASEVSVDKAAEELGSTMREALVLAGLTQDEARAMLATWDGHWFRESGTRVLAVLPQKWVDSVLPLTITPSPTKVTRVFVARFEALTPDRESTLLSLLNETANAKDSDATTARFDSLNLGRFARGALLRAQNLQTQRMNEQFWKLLQTSKMASDRKATAAR